MKEYQCDGKTTHYMGCQCHEARWEKELASRDARIAELEAENARLREALQKIDEPLRYHHWEDDPYTRAGCFQFVAHEALKATDAGASMLAELESLRRIRDAAAEAMEWLCQHPEAKAQKLAHPDIRAWCSDCSNYLRSMEDATLPERLADALAAHAARFGEG